MAASTAPTRRMTAASFGKMPTTRARRLISLFTRSNGFVDHTFPQCARGNEVNANPSAFAASISGPILGKPVASWSRTVSQVPDTACGGGWAKMVRNTAAALCLGGGWGDEGGDHPGPHVLVAFRHQGGEIPGKVDPADSHGHPLGMRRCWG